jgi:Carboxypeptidase regulatory-like domain
MERMRIVFATILVGGFLLAAGTSSAEVTCEALRLKPLRCVCGTVIDEAGEVVSDAAVTILKHGTEIATVQTRRDGKFSFEELKAGSYDLFARAVGFRLFEFPIVVESPEKKCKHTLEIVLVGGFETCTMIRMVKR